MTEKCKWDYIYSQCLSLFFGAPLINKSYISNQSLLFVLNCILSTNSPTINAREIRETEIRGEVISAWWEFSSSVDL